MSKSKIQVLIKRGNGVFFNVMNLLDQMDRESVSKYLLLYTGFNEIRLLSIKLVTVNQNKHTYCNGYTFDTLPKLICTYLFSM